MDGKDRCSCGGTCESSGIDPVSLGILLGIANVLVIAVGMGMTEPRNHLGIALGVFALGFFPGVFTGGLLGRTAHRVRAWRPWARQIVLTGPALFVVVVLAEVFQAHQFMVLAFIPTVAAASWRERRTREALVPIARAR